MGVSSALSIRRNWSVAAQMARRALFSEQIGLPHKEFNGVTAPNRAETIGLTLKTPLYFAYQTGLQLLIGGHRVGVDNVEGKYDLPAGIFTRAAGLIGLGLSVAGLYEHGAPFPSAEYDYAHLHLRNMVLASGMLTMSGSAIVDPTRSRIGNIGFGSVCSMVGLLLLSTACMPWDDGRMSSLLALDINLSPTTLKNIIYGDMVVGGALTAAGVKIIKTGLINLRERGEPLFLHPDEL